MLYSSSPHRRSLSALNATTNSASRRKRLRRHLYYVCRKKKADAKCQQQPVAAIDLEPSLIEQLEPILGPDFDGAFLQHSLERITYDSRTHEASLWWTAVNSVTRYRLRGGRV